MFVVVVVVVPKIGIAAANVKCLSGCQLKLQSQFNGQCQYSVI